MLYTRIANACSGRFHHAWMIRAVVFTSMLAGVGVRAAPSGMILPLQKASGCDVSTLSDQVSLNIVLLAATGLCLTGLMQVIALKRTMIDTALPTFMNQSWQLFLTGGLVADIGSDAVGFAGAIANRWRVHQAGLATELLTSAHAAAQLPAGAVCSPPGNCLMAFIPSGLACQNSHRYQYSVSSPAAQWPSPNRVKPV